MQATPELCAQELLDVVPLIMRAIRTEMRSRRSRDLTVPQFRALLFIHSHPETSLSDVADHIGLTLPTLSKMVDGLVARRLVIRKPSPEDRRRIKLTITSSGQVQLEAARKGTQERLADILTSLSESERNLVLQASKALRPIFTPGEAG
jgi:DNA-binding MarR family transcriptional regulator